MRLPALLLAPLLAGLAAAFSPVSAFAATPEPPPAAAEAPVEQGVRLLMVERDGCIYCRRWREEVLPEYALTDEGKAAPLATVELDGPWPDGLALGRKPVFTPTFVLLRDGQELDRIEGYVGEDFFWPVLRDMMLRHGVPLAGG